MTKRHNQLANVVRNIVVKFVGKDPRSEITELGDADGQTSYGDCRKNGRDVPGDLVKVVHYHRLGAEQKNVYG
jgi:TPR repeat protein